MQWMELSVQAHPEAVEAVSELLSRYTNETIAIEEPIELINDGQEYRVLPGQPVLLHAYLPIDGREEEVRQRVAEGLWHLSSLGERFVGELQTRVVKEEDWANAWKDYYHVTHIGRRLVIRPSWREYTPAADEVVITLDPGMAFGTGLHPTTRMCLEQVERRVRPGMRVLDVGTGSGILALAAAKLGAAHVYAIDNSSVAVESATENATMNGLSDRITVVEGTLDEAQAERMAGQYDLVLANIIAHIIGALAPQLARMLAPQGVLVVSGIIEERRADAEGPLLEAGLELVEQTMIDDWLALVLRRRG
ncbi:MAG TPA: 50S ribosomal protein L11 methyltransferase [Ktedonobacteraceae bacterium]|nr:50S ribosomal protein L11 methyltransferase [Ktedonobacteraceae bacterium]